MKTPKLPPGSSSEGGASRSDFFHDLASRKVDRPDAPPSYARKTALILGAVLGLGYGLSTQFINSILSPGIPFAHYPFGIVGNCIASMLGMMLVCTVCALPKDSYRGALFGSVAVFVILELRALFLGTPLLIMLRSIASVFALMGILFEIVLSIPVMLGLRWTIDIQKELFYKPVWSWRRLRFPLAFLIGVMALSIFSVYPDDARLAMASTTAMIDRGLSASSPEDLPAPLQNENHVQDFLRHASSSYTVELGDQSLLAEDVSPQLQGFVIVVIARFKSHWSLVCVYVNRLDDPTCQSHSPLDAPPVTDFRASQYDRSIPMGSSSI